MKILNNKWAIAGLIAGAGYLVYSNVVVSYNQFANTPEDEQITGDIDSILAEHDDLNRDHVEQELQLATAQFDLKKIDIGGVRWNESPARDPFSALSTLENHQIEAVQNKVESTPAVGRSVKVKAPVIEAIVNSAKKSFVVIGGEIFQRGDRIGDFQVIAISRGGVDLMHARSGHSINLKVSK